MDATLKESILGDLRIANRAIELERPELGLQVLEIALARMKKARA